MVHALDDIREFIAHRVREGIESRSTMGIARFSFRRFTGKMGGTKPVVPRLPPARIKA